MQWPQFLIAHSQGTYLWGERRSVLRLRLEEREGDIAKTIVEETGAGRGMDRLQAAAMSTDGTLALLDSSGRVALHQAVGGRSITFTADTTREYGEIAISGGTVYLLVEASAAGEPEVVAYTQSGGAVGRWGSAAASGLIQGALDGGGIVACPDGSIYYSLINSPVVWRLPDAPGAEPQEIGEPPQSFETISRHDVEEALEEVERLHGEVVPLVELGLSGSRVMALHCSLDGTLLRQVAHPDRDGTVVEVWDPRRGRTRSPGRPPRRAAPRASLRQLFGRDAVSIGACTV